jgi:site-specific recombinase XerD
MLSEIYPRFHTRFSSLRVLGPHLDGFVGWLRSKGFPLPPICARLRAAKRLDRLLWRRGIREPGDLTSAKFRAFAPRDSQQDIDLTAVVRSLTKYFEERQALAPAHPTLGQELIAHYRSYLHDVRGFAASTVSHHVATAHELLVHLESEHDPRRLRKLAQRQIEDFVAGIAERVGRESVQHSVAHLRAFLRFLASRDLAPVGLDTQIDTPRVYRGEKLPRALPWETVRAFLRSIDRSTSMGRRDYAMFMLIVTYGLRSCEVVSLKLDDIEWRSRRLCVSRPKVRSALVLPLTDEVAAAMLAYLQDGRPDLPHREVFLRERAPTGTLKPTAVTEAFQGRVRRSGLPIRYQGPHCLRHSLAVHLLRQGTPLKAIGDLLGHRSAESTCVYLRLHVEDLRDVAIELPAAAQSKVRP